MSLRTYVTRYGVAPDVLAGGWSEQVMGQKCIPNRLVNCNLLSEHLRHAHGSDGAVIVLEPRLAPRRERQLALVDKVVSV